MDGNVNGTGEGGAGKKSGGFRQRLISGIVIVAIAALIFALSGYPYVFPACVAILTVICNYELLKSVKGNTVLIFAGVGTLGALFQFMPFMNYYMICAVLLAVCEIGFGAMILFTGRLKITNVLFMIFFCVLFSLLARSAVEIRNLDHGLFLLILIFSVTELTDIFAYLTGRKFGRHKLAPKVSPKKTVEGFIGGIVFAVLIGFGVSLIYAKAGGLEFNPVLLIVCLLLITLQGQFGDLALSAVKRSVGIGDFSNLIPGHGGMMDRLDSLTFTLPLLYLIFATSSVFW